jgi:hypothetical protein
LCALCPERTRRRLSLVRPRTRVGSAELVVDPVSKLGVLGEVCDDERQAGLGEVVLRQVEGGGDALCQLAACALTARASEDTREVVTSHTDKACERAEAEPSLL